MIVFEKHIAQLVVRIHTPLFACIALALPAWQYRRVVLVTSGAVGGFTLTTWLHVVGSYLLILCCSWVTLTTWVGSYLTLVQLGYTYYVVGGGLTLVCIWVQAERHRQVHQHFAYRGLR